MKANSILARGTTRRRLVLWLGAALIVSVVSAGMVVRFYPTALPGGVVATQADGSAAAGVGAVNPAADAATQASGLDAPKLAAIPDQCSFATVRIDPSGRAVIAGRAEPSASATIRDGTTTIGQATADELGDWLLLTQDVLAPGAHLLALEARRGDQPVHAALQMVVLEVAGAADKPSDAEDRRAVALMVPSNGFGASTVLQAPEASHEAATVPVAELAIEVIDFTPYGIIAVGGRAVPGAAIAVSIGGRVINSVETSPQGRWHVDVDNRAPRAHQTVRVEQHDKHAQLVAFDEKTFDESAGIGALSGAPADRPVVVTEGDGFTRIARRVGNGGVQLSLVYQRQTAAKDDLRPEDEAKHNDTPAVVAPRDGAKLISPSP